MRGSAPKFLNSGMTSRSYWTAVWCGFLVLTIGLGVRQSFGIFLKPVSAELHAADVVVDDGDRERLLRLARSEVEMARRKRVIRRCRGAATTR